MLKTQFQWQTRENKYKHSVKVIFKKYKNLISNVCNFNEYMYKYYWFFLVVNLYVHITFALKNELGTLPLQI